MSGKVRFMPASSASKVQARQRNAGTSFRPFKAIEPGSLKDAVARLIDQAGGVKRVMLTLQLGKSQVYAYADEQHPAEISLRQAAALTTPAAPSVAQWLAALAGGVFLPLAGEGEGELHTMTADSAREFGEAMGVVVASLADGTIDGAEAARCIGEIDDAMRSLAGLRAALQERLDDTTGGLGSNDGRSSGTPNG